jgi:hypothetical protein
MPPELPELLDRAKSASGDELKALLHEPREEILAAILENAHCEETHIVLLLERLDISSNLVEAISRQTKWSSSEAVRLRLACHPRTPKRVALAVLRQLYLFDLVRVSLLPSAPPDIKRLAEETIVSRVSHLPVGQKLTLARRGPSRVAGALLAEGHAQAVELALNNPFLTESQILKVLAKQEVPERTVAAIARHPKWVCRQTVRLALLRNRHTPAAVALEFLPHLSLRDLTDVSGLEDLAPHLRGCIQEEIARRSKSREHPDRG